MHSITRMVKQAMSNKEIKDCLEHGLKLVRAFRTENL